MNFEDLEVWKRSKQLCVSIYMNLMNLKDYSFKDQITSSGLSIPCNIAEGFERGTQRECMNFLSYSRGSCGELRTQIAVGIEIGYIPKEIGEKWAKEAKEISSMLSSLIKTKRRFIEQAKSKAHVPRS
jgi:four helix bundle protein